MSAIIHLFENEVNFRQVADRLPQGNDAVTASWRQLAAGIRAAVLHHVERRRVLDRDAGLTAAGVNAVMQREAERIGRPELEKLEAALAGIDAQHGRVLASLAPSRPDPADVAAALLRFQAREVLRTAPLAERVQMAFAGGELFAEGIEESLGLFTGLTDEQLTDFRAIRHEAALRAHPKEAEQLAIMEGAHAVLLAFWQSAMLAMVALAAIPEDEAQGRLRVAEESARLASPRGGVAAETAKAATVGT